RRNEELDRHMKLIAQGEQAKQRICEQLLAGELTLAEAAARFRAVEEGWPDACKVKLQSYPGESEQERRCHYVIAFVRSMLEDGDRSVDDLSTRLRRDSQSNPAPQPDIPQSLDLRD